MKNYFDSSVLLVALFVFLFSCEQAVDKELAPGKITFGFSGNVDGRVAEGFNPKAILISVVNANGVSIANLKRMELYNFSGSYLTNEELELLPGSYSITQLLVVDESNAVTHVLPVEGSQHAHLVEDAAPIHFSVGSGEHKTQTIQVVKVEGSANEYGYVTFEVEEVSILKKIKSISTYEKSINYDEFALTSKVMYLYDEEGNLVEVDYWQYAVHFNDHWLDQKIRITYNSQNEVVEVNGFDRYDTLVSVWYYEYGDNRELKTVTHHNVKNGDLQPANFKTELAYSNVNELLTYSYENGQWKLFKREEFDDNGNIAYSYYPGSGDVIYYEYDSNINPEKHTALFNTINSAEAFSQNNVTCQNLSSNNEKICSLITCENEYPVIVRKESGGLIFEHYYEYY